MALSAAQLAALAHVTRHARSRRADALMVLDHICRMCDISQDALSDALAGIKSHAQVAVHFHPDRPWEGDRTSAEGLLEAGRYRSQFETRLSSGSLSAHAGGSRDRWEDRLFGGAYQLPGTSDSERPKYGSLDLLRHPDGPSPRFGSCYFLLTPGVSQRCTYTYLDSHEDRREKGTYEEFEDIVAALLSEAFERDHALGERDVTPARLVQRLRTQLSAPLQDPAGSPAVRNLNHYIEAQIHGDLVLEDDVDAVVADPSFRGTDTGRILEQLSQRYGVALYWHSGSVLACNDVPRDFRGPSMPSLAARVARAGVVDASAIGDAARDLHRQPDAWLDRGTYPEVLQELKLLWHVLVKFGKPDPRPVRMWPKVES